MTNITTRLDSLQPAAEAAVHLFDDWFDPIETGVRDRVRGFIQELIHGELDGALARPHYGRVKNSDGGDDAAGVSGHPHGSRTRSLTGTFGKTEITVPRARLVAPDGKTTEWKSKALRAYQRRTLAADALIEASRPRPKVSPETRALIRWISMATPLWRAPPAPRRTAHARYCR
jgi:hypothetical protein